MTGDPVTNQSLPLRTKKDVARYYEASYYFTHNGAPVREGGRLVAHYGTKEWFEIIQRKYTK